VEEKLESRLELVSIGGKNSVGVLIVTQTIVAQEPF
jgi:hypothetical protein